jgi:hypothetical protein
VSKLLNGYACSVEQDTYEQTPKAVWAAIAVSALTTGGDFIEHADRRVRREWWVLYRNGIVPQKPPFADPGDEEDGGRS